MLLTFSLKKTYLVFSTCNRFLHIYLSKNATPWHHSRISLWGRKKYNSYAKRIDGGICVCDSCKLKRKNKNSPIQPTKGGGA